MQKNYSSVNKTLISVTIQISRVCAAPQLFTIHSSLFIIHFFCSIGELVHIEYNIEKNAKE